MTKKKLQLDLVETVALLSNVLIALVPIFLNKSVREQAFYSVVHGVIYFVSLYTLLSKYGYTSKIKVLFIVFSALLIWSLILLYVNIGMVGKFN